MTSGRAEDRRRMRSLLRDARNGFVFGFAATIGAFVALGVLGLLFRWLH